MLDPVCLFINLQIVFLDTHTQSTLFTPPNFVCASEVYIQRRCRWHMNSNNKHLLVLLVTTHSDCPIQTIIYWQKYNMNGKVCLLAKVPTNCLPFDWNLCAWIFLLSIIISSFSLEWWIRKAMNTFRFQVHRPHIYGTEPYLMIFYGPFD